jgi:hypothetical protein
MPARQLLVWDLMPYAAIFEVDFSRRKFPYKAGIQRRKKTDNIASCRIYLKSWKTTQPSANFPQCNIRLRAWTDEFVFKRQPASTIGFMLRFYPERRAIMSRSAF